MIKVTSMYSPQAGPHHPVEVPFKELAQNMSEEAPNQQGSNRWEGSASSEQRKSKYYLSSIMVVPEALENPLSQQKSPTKELFESKRIKTLKATEKFFQIQFTETPEHLIQRQDVSKKYHFSNPELQNELSKMGQFLRTSMPQYTNKVANKMQQWEMRYREFCSQKEGKPVMIWFMKLRKNGPKVKYISLSKQLLSMIGYSMSDLPLELQSFREMSLEFFNAKTYGTSFLSYTSSFRKFVSSELYQDIPKEAIIEQSQKMVENEMKGKINCRMNMRLYTPQPFILVYEAEDILHQGPPDLSESKRAARREMRNKVDSNAYRSLHRIAKMPESFKPRMNRQICHYKQIYKEEESEDKSMQGASSQGMS